MSDSSEFYYIDENGAKADADLHAQLLEDPADPVAVRAELEFLRRRLIAEGEDPKLVARLYPDESGQTVDGQSLILAPGWYREIAADGVDPTQPSIYEWRIEGVGVYIGQCSAAKRPRRAYGVAVSNLRNGKPYRKSKPYGFRAIHRELLKAIGRAQITLTFLETVSEKEDRNRRERSWIALRKREATATGLRVFNSA